MDKAPVRCWDGCWDGGNRPNNRPSPWGRDGCWDGCGQEASVFGAGESINRESSGAIAKIGLMVTK